MGSSAQLSEVQWKENAPLGAVAKIFNCLLALSSVSRVHGWPSVTDIQREQDTGKGAQPVDPGAGEAEKGSGNLVGPSARGHGLPILESATKPPPLRELKAPASPVPQRENVVESGPASIDQSSSPSPSPPLSGVVGGEAEAALMLDASMSPLSRRTESRSSPPSQSLTSPPPTTNAASRMTSQGVTPPSSSGTTLSSGHRRFHDPSPLGSSSRWSSPKSPSLGDEGVGMRRGASAPPAVSAVPSPKREVTADETMASISLLQHELEAEREEVVRLRKQLSEERSLSLRHRPPQSAWHGSWTHASPPGSVSAPPPPLASDPAKASSTTSKKWVSFFSRFNVDNMRRSSSVSYLQSAVTLLAEELLICEQRLLSSEATAHRLKVLLEESERKRSDVGVTGSASRVGSQRTEFASRNPIGTNAGAPIESSTSPVPGTEHLPTSRRSVPSTKTPDAAQNPPERLRTHVDQMFGIIEDLGGVLQRNRQTVDEAQRMDVPNKYPVSALHSNPLQVLRTNGMGSTAGAADGVTTKLASPSPVKTVVGGRRISTSPVRGSPKDRLSSGERDRIMAETRALVSRPHVPSPPVRSSFLDRLSSPPVTSITTAGAADGSSTIKSNSRTPEDRAPPPSWRAAWASGSVGEERQSPPPPSKSRLFDSNQSPHSSSSGNSGMLSSSSSSGVMSSSGGTKTSASRPVEDASAATRDPLMRLHGLLQKFSPHKAPSTSASTVPAPRQEDSEYTLFSRAEPSPVTTRSTSSTTANHIRSGPSTSPALLSGAVSNNPPVVAGPPRPSSSSSSSSSSSHPDPHFSAAQPSSVGGTLGAYQPPHGSSFLSFYTPTPSMQPSHD